LQNPLTRAGPVLPPPPRVRTLRRGLAWFGVKLVLAVIVALIPLLFALSLQIGSMLAGFPDNHVTDYDKAMVLPDRIFIGANLAAAGCLFLMLLVARNKRAIGRAGLTLIFYVGFFFTSYYMVASYFTDVLGLDFGQGG
jgi:hypothetical protein